MHLPPSQVCNTECLGISTTILDCVEMIAVSNTITWVAKTTNYVYNRNPVLSVKENAHRKSVTFLAVESARILRG